MKKKIIRFLLKHLGISSYDIKRLYFFKLLEQAPWERMFISKETVQDYGFDFIESIDWDEERCGYMIEKKKERIL